MKSSLQQEDTATNGDGSETNPHCVDSLEECPQWAREGECFVNPLFMLKSCRYSCWICINTPKDRERGIDEKITARKVLYSKMNVGANQLVLRTSNQTSLEWLTFQKVLSMEYYAKSIIADPKVPKKTRERCANHHRMCATWAAQGMCTPFGYNEKNDQLIESNHDASSLMGKDRVLFMMNLCPLACEMCHEITSFHQCAGKRSPLDQPSFDVGSGSINSFFERKGLPYQPIFVSHPNAEEESSADDPYVVVLQNFLSSDEADALKSLPSSNHARASNGTSRWNLRADAQQSNRIIASCSIDNACSQDDTYMKIMDRMSSLVDVHVSYVEPMEVIQFNPLKQQSNTMSRLEHNFEVDSLWKPAGPRVLSLFIFLSDVNNDDADQGGNGGLGFPYLDWLYIKPKKGMAVLWPNVRSDDLWQLDPLTKFEYFPLQDKGGDDINVHFGAMSHIRLYNYTDAYLRGCV